MSDMSTLQARALSNRLPADAISRTIEPGMALSPVKEQSGIWRQSIMTSNAAMYSKYVTPQRGVSQQGAGAAKPFSSKISGPTKVLLEIFSRWQISDTDAAILLGGRSPLFVDRLRSGAAGLSERDTKDRAKLLILIYEGVHSLLRGAEAEQSWIRSRHSGLGDHSLLETMLLGSVLDLFRAQAFVQYANGR